MTTSPLSTPSFAKVNLSLRILGKRPDNYHEIQTVLQAVSLHDTLNFAKTSSGSIAFTCDDATIPLDANNLVVKAAEALRERFQVPSSCEIHLAKRIPVQAGLGGGSSNAAMTLLALTRLWQLPATSHDLLAIATTLGADVPFFIEGGCAFATGTGTELTPLPDLPQQHLLIITPAVNVSTATAYQALKAPALTTSESVSILAISRTQANFSDSKQWVLCDHLENDFERVIFDMEPEIRRVKEALIQAGARCALLAGSGSSVFGIFDNDEQLRSAGQTLKQGSGWRVFSCVTLSRDEYLRALNSANPGR